MNKFNIKDRVTVFSKNASGKIAYIGKTHFSEGEWFGVILDEAKGKNNGCVDGRSYFNCPRNHGIFVRSNQLEMEAPKGENVKPFEVRPVCNAYNLCNNASINTDRSEDAENAMNNVKNKKAAKQQLLPRNATIKDLESTLKKQSKELSDLKIKKREVDENIKTMEEEILKMTEELNKRSKTENDLNKNLTIAQRDIAVLKRKLRNTEKNFELSEMGRRKLHNGIEQLREITEAAVIEKEIAEEKSEHFEALVKEEVHKGKTLEIEMEIMKEEMQLQCINGIPTKHYVNMLENRNKVFYCALQKLKDLYHGLQQQIKEYKIVAENNSNEIKCLKEIEKSKEKLILECEEEVAELYNTINDMTDADDVVFEVTEQNLKLETKIDNLYQQLNSAEDELEISEEVQETLFELKSICREEIDCLEAKVRRTQMALEQQVLLHKSNEEVIHKYQELTTILRERNQKLSDELERILRERKEAVIEAENLKLKIYQEKRRNLTDIIQVENMKYDLESFKEELNYWSPFMPENFFVEGGENSVIQVKLFTSKLIKRLGLIIKFMKASYPKSDRVKTEDLKSLTIKTRFLIFAIQLQSFLKIFDKSFDFTDTEQFLMLGKYHRILARKEEDIENYLSYLCKDEIDTENCLDSIRETFYSLRHLLEIKYIPKFMEIMINSECYLSLTLICCRCIMFYCLLFKGFDGITPDYKNNIQQIMNVVKKFKIYSRSILICAKNNHKEKLYFHPIVERRAMHSWQLMNDVMNSLISVYHCFRVEDREFSHGANNPDKVSLEEIIRNLTQIEIDLEYLQKALNNGELLVEQVAESQIASPICRWVQNKKQEEEARTRNLRNNIASCEREIFDLSQTLHTKMKQDNQREGDTLRDVSSQTKEFNMKFEAGDSSVTDYLRIKLQDMERSMKYLSQKNFELRVAPMKRHQSILTPLKVLPRPKYPPEIHDICVLQKRLNKLSVNLRGIIVPLVVDITKKSSCKRRKYKKYLAERIQIFQKIDEELWLISIEIRKMRKTSRCISSNIKPFSLRNVEWY